MLVVDASLVVELALDRVGERASLDLDRGGELIAPPLPWSEVPSVLHEISFRGEISDALAELALQRFLSGRLPISERRPAGHAARLGRSPWNSAGRRPTTPSTSRSQKVKAVASSPLTAGCDEEPIASASLSLQRSSPSHLTVG
jgi:hypothetical protein